jgi:hypothetical protein
VYPLTCGAGAAIAKPARQADAIICLNDMIDFAGKETVE